MCMHCRQPAPNRRGFLSLAAAGIAASAAFGGGRAFAADAGPAATPGSAKRRQCARRRSVGEAQGRQREICRSPQRLRDQSVGAGEAARTGGAEAKAVRRDPDLRGQPRAARTGVRRPRPRRIFVARNAGNIADTATIGTIEYGVEHLGVRLVVVLGHQNCGAVGAACDIVDKHATFPGAIGPMLGAIVPSALAVRGKPGDFVDNTVRENADANRVPDRDGKRDRRSLHP